MIKKGLTVYAESNEELTFLINSLDIQNETERENRVFSMPYLSDFNFLSHRDFLREDSLIILTEIFGDIDADIFREKITLEEFWRIVFDYILATKKILILEEIIRECGRIYQTDMREVCKALRLYHHTGTIQKIEDYGYYVFPLTFNSQNLCFLHPLAIPKQKKDSMSNFEVGQTITFSIIGFNMETSRINIFCLKKV